jgi:hypothetical protein
LSVGSCEVDIDNYISRIWNEHLADIGETELNTRVWDSRVWDSRVRWSRTRLRPGRWRRGEI